MLLASVLIANAIRDDGLEGVSYIPYPKDIVGVWTVCHKKTPGRNVSAAVKRIQSEMQTLPE